MKSIRAGVPWILLACAALLSTSAVADIPPATSDCADDLVETTPSSDFTVLDGGAVVRHEPTGLEWRRCVEGMAWTGTGCTGSAIEMTWQGALQHADALPGWRLPSVSELHTIVERCKRWSPEFNRHVFPGSPSGFYWTASPDVGRSDLAWTVITSGGDATYYKYSKRKVRLVRGGY